MFRGPTMWLYAENDSMYGTSHSRGNYDVFIESGGRGEFILYSLPAGTDGHRLIDDPQAWQESVGEFLQKLDSKR